MEELWKPVTDYPNYEVSNFGGVRNTATNKILKICVSKYKNKNYSIAIVNLSNGGDRNKRKKIVARLVANAFVTNEFNRPEVNHLDFNPLNNNANNLEWVTHKENVLYSARARRGRWSNYMTEEEKEVRNSEFRKITERLLKGEVNFIV